MASTAPTVLLGTVLAGFRRLIPFMGLFVFLQVLHSPAAKAGELVVTVSGVSGPWEWVNGGLNTQFPYGQTAHDFAPPPVVTANPSAGIPFTVGNQLTLAYVSGLWDIGDGNSVDANGDPAQGVITSYADAQNPYWGLNPSYWCLSSDFPHYPMALMGVFTDSSGSIIGVPYVIGDNRTLIVPAGATQLQLGAEDSYFADNSGSVNISVTETPEPSTLVLLCVGAVGLVGYGLRRRRVTRTAKPTAFDQQDDPPILAFPSESRPASSGARRAA